MRSNKDYLNISAEGAETPYGHLYPLPKLSTQILFVVAFFLTAILLGLTISIIPGDLSDLAKGVIYFIYYVLLGRKPQVRGVNLFFEFLYIHLSISLQH